MVSGLRHKLFMNCVKVVVNISDDKTLVLIMWTWIYLLIVPDILSHVYQAEIFTGAFVFLTLSVLNIRYTTCRLGGEKLLQIS